MCRKELPFTKIKSIDIFTLWLFFAMIGGKYILRIVLWCSGLLLMNLTCVMGICGPYIASALLMSSMIIGQSLI